MLRDVGKVPTGFKCFKLIGKTVTEVILKFFLATFFFFLKTGVLMMFYILGLQ